MCSEEVIFGRLEGKTCLASVVVEQFNEYAGQLAFHVHSLRMGSKRIFLRHIKKAAYVDSLSSLIYSTLLSIFYNIRVIPV